MPTKNRDKKQLFSTLNLKHNYPLPEPTNKGYSQKNIRLYSTFFLFAIIGQSVRL